MADSFLSQHMIAVKMATIKQNRYKRGTTLLENPVSARSNINDLQPNSRRNCRRWVRTGAPIREKFAALCGQQGCGRFTSGYLV
jgi:hypothetical protein